MNKSINERIEYIRNYFCKGNNNLFAARLKKTTQNTSNYVRQGYNIGKGVANEIAAEFGVNINWLLKGEGDMLTDANKQSTSNMKHTEMDTVTLSREAWDVIRDQASAIRQMMEERAQLREELAAAKTERMPATSGVLATAVRDSQNPPPLRNESK